MNYQAVLEKISSKHFPASQVLSGMWFISTDQDNIGRESRWFDDIAMEAKQTSIPGIIQQVFHDYHGVAWYWHKFSPVSRMVDSSRFLLCFEAVDYLAEVWLNGVYVGTHEGGEAPFTLDVSDALRFNEDNLLAVRVINPGHVPIDDIVLNETPHRNKVVPFFSGGSYNHGGIMGPVELKTCPAVSIADLYVCSRPETGRVNIQTLIYNSEPDDVEGNICFSIAPAKYGTTVNSKYKPILLAPGENLVEEQMQVDNPILWDVKQPYLYRLTANISTGMDSWGDEYSVRFGFRDFRFEDGYFKLNGRRIFLRSAHTTNHYPVGMQFPLERDLFLRDLLCMKAMGFNAIRFIAGMPSPCQLDMCDDIGLMVYEESYAGWCMRESPKMAERYDRSMREMIIRDRNHPSIVIWGMLNENSEGAVFRHAVSSIPLVRSLDDSRLLILNSGRFDFQKDIGEICNPGSMKWEKFLGNFDAGKPDPQWAKIDGCGLVEGAGDAHMYPSVPHSKKTMDVIRNLGKGSKPVFLSEYGIGSAVDLVRVVALYEQIGWPESVDANYYRIRRDLFLQDWSKWGMDEIFGRPEDYFKQCLRSMASKRLVGLNAIRSNPNIIGYNLTGAIDQGLTGEGLMTTFREFKPGTVDAMSDGLAPLRWCLFAEPLNVYSGNAVKLEAVIANEDVLLPGEYPVRMQVFGPNCENIFDYKTIVTISENTEIHQPLAIKVFEGDVTIVGPSGKYRFVASFEHGAAPCGGEIDFFVANHEDLPKIEAEIVLWAEDTVLQKWLMERGIRHRLYRDIRDCREIILVTKNAPQPCNTQSFVELAGAVARGSTVVILSPDIFSHENSSGVWFWDKDKSSICDVPSDLYNKDVWAKHHPIFDGLPTGGILDELFYRELIPRCGWNGPQKPDEAIAGANRCSLHPNGYISGLFMSVHRLGAGKFILNTFNILENLGSHPAADRLISNIIRYAQTLNKSDAPLIELPSGFSENMYKDVYRPHCGSTYKRKWLVSDILPALEDISMIKLPDDSLTWNNYIPAIYTENPDFIDLYLGEITASGLVFAKGAIFVPKEMTCELMLGTDGPCKVWIGNSEIGLVKEAMRCNPSRDKYIYPLTLKAGRQFITLAFNRQSYIGRGFYMRFKRIDSDWTKEELQSGMGLIPIVDTD